MPKVSSFQPYKDISSKNPKMWSSQTYLCVDFWLLGGPAKFCLDHIVMSCFCARGCVNLNLRILIFTSVVLLGWLSWMWYVYVCFKCRLVLLMIGVSNALFQHFAKTENSFFCSAQRLASNLKHVTTTSRGQLQCVKLDSKHSGLTALHSL